MGMSSSKTKTKQTTSQTSKPITPDWIAKPIQGYTGKIDQFMNTDPANYVAPASELQQQAFAGAKDLGGWKAPATTALEMAAQGVNAPAAQANVSNAQAASYNAPKLGAASQVGSTAIAPTTNATASQAGVRSILDNGGIQKYMDPAIQSYVDASMAEYDAQSGRSRAALEAGAAKSGAFGGSRMGIAQGAFEADTNRGRALTDSSLRAQAYAQALAAAGGDADRAAQSDFTNAGLATGVSTANAGFANSRATNQASLDQQRLMANTDAANQFKLSQAGFDANAGQFNAGNKQQASMFNAQAANTGSMFNAQQQEAAAQRALQGAGVTSNIANSIANNSQTDLALTGQLGEMQRAIEQAQKNALPTQLQLGGALYGGLPYPAFVGQQGDGTMTGTTKSSPGIGGMLGGLAGSALSGWASGGFKF